MDNKHAIASFIIAILMATVSYFLCNKYFEKGKQSQIKENINRGVMDDKGKWLPEFRIAIEKEAK